MPSDTETSWLLPSNQLFMKTAGCKRLKFCLDWVHFLIKRGKEGREPWEDQKNRLAVYRNPSYVSLSPLKLFIVKAEKCPSWHSFLPCCQGGGQRQDFPLHLPVSFYRLSTNCSCCHNRDLEPSRLSTETDPYPPSIWLSREAQAARTYLFAGLGLTISVTEFTFHKRPKCHCLSVSAKKWAKSFLFS